MSGLVIELQSDALDPGIRVSDLLRKALVVSRKLEITTIQDWLLKELNGYPSDAQFPGYREVRGQVSAWNPYYGWQPVIFENAESANVFSKRLISQSVGELDSILASGGEMQVPFPDDIVNLLTKDMDVPLRPTLIVSSSEVVGILDAIRNTVLDWALTLERQGIMGEGMTFSKREKQVANQISYQVTTNIGSMQNSQLQQDSAGAVQSLRVGVDLREVLKFLDSINRQMDKLNLPEPERNELLAEIGTLESQLKSPKPKPSIVNEALNSIRTILEGAAGNMVAAGLLGKLSELL